MVGYDNLLHQYNCSFFSEKVDHVSLKTAIELSFYMRADQWHSMKMYLTYAFNCVMT